MLIRAVTVFLAAFLLFQLQPIVAKAILPWFGGAPAVWTSCVLFFQSLLLVGYAYAHASTRTLRPRTQGAVHLVLVAGALFVLPIAPDATGVPTGSAMPILHILAVLARSVALPYFVLCASTPLLQSWVALDRGASSPYRLYALSNAGSMLALLSYPIAIEPWLTTAVQENAWSAAFAGFAPLSAMSVRVLWRSSEPAIVTVAAHDNSPAAAPVLGQRLLWLALPACASTLLLAVTNQMCQEVAVIPLLWILPLSLYLFSFVLCFESDRWYSRSWCLPVLTLTLIALAHALAMGARVGVLYAVPVYSIGLFVCCMFCHGELAARRPAARHLTSFNLMIALGGALGGAFVSLLAPLLFRGFDELYVGLLACGALAAAFTFKSSTQRSVGKGTWHPALPALLAVVISIGAIFGMRLMTPTRPGLRELRNFYGILCIQDLASPDGSGGMRYMTHGGTRHGQQYQDPIRRALPTTYYGRASGAGILLDELSTRAPLRVGFVGLGAGVLATYGRAGDTYRFYEINPQVIDVAQREFTFLDDSPAEIEIVAGDARLSLEREASQHFAVLVLDAFSSDAIPVHLLTREAFELYERHLVPDGVLAFHVTTRHLDLAPLIAALARERQQQAWEILSPADDSQAVLDARWILVTSNRDLLARPRIQAAGRAVEVGANPPRIWTDDYSNLLQFLK